MLFFTGSDNHLSIQTNPSKSLGGYISCSQVPNDLLNNIFSDIDYSAIKNNLTQLRVIAFQNISGNNISSLKVYTNTPSNSFAKIKIGLVHNSVDPSCNIPYFEQIQNENSSPFYVELNECEGEEGYIELTNIPVNNYVGIFLQRVLIEANNSDFKGRSKTCEELIREFEQSQSQTGEVLKKEQDDIEIIFDIS